VSGGAVTAVIEWSSPNYDYMVVSGEKYSRRERDGQLRLEIPVTVFDFGMAVSADTRPCPRQRTPRDRLHAVFPLRHHSPRGIARPAPLLKNKIHPTGGTAMKRTVPLILAALLLLLLCACGGGYGAAAPSPADAPAPEQSAAPRRRTCPRRTGPPSAAWDTRAAALAIRRSFRGYMGGLQLLTIGGGNRHC
jgi:hypothetical protein